MQVLEAQGQELVAPSERSGLHPLLIPLTQEAGSGRVTCLLRWAEPGTHKVLAQGWAFVMLPAGLLTLTLAVQCMAAMCLAAGQLLHQPQALIPGSCLLCPHLAQDLALPVVAMARGAPTLSMLARSPEEYMHRLVLRRRHAARARLTLHHAQVVC